MCVSERESGERESGERESGERERERERERGREFSLGFSFAFEVFNQTGISGRFKSCNNPINQLDILTDIHLIEKKFKFQT